MRTVAAAAAALVVLAGGVFAQNVNLPNGNFYVGYVDIDYDASPLRIERAYNAKSAFKSIFGWGWGIDLATYLIVLPDDSIVLSEWGGGRVDRFVSDRVTPEATKAAVDSMVKAWQESGGVVNAADIENLRVEWVRDAEERERIWEKMLKARLVKPHDLRAGTLLRSTRNASETIERTADGYVLREPGSGERRFDRFGKMTRIGGAGGAIDLTYDAAGLLASASDGKGHRLSFHLNDRGLLERLDGTGGKHATYKYNDSDQLIASDDADGQRYKFEYDKRHNLTRIGYADGTFRQMTYFPDPFRDSIKRHRQPDGSWIDYDYASAWKNKDDYRTTVSTFTSSGQLVSRETHRFLGTRDARGILTYTELVYDGECRLITTVAAAILEAADAASRGTRYPCRP